MGSRDWGVGIGDWALAISPPAPSSPSSPSSPHSPLPTPLKRRLSPYSLVHYLQIKCGIG
ncbi:hypothetical protein H1Q63_12135 [Desmonostoc muscorum CCALA 125]|nr:hypothetical protein [Desmonostoc muscorum CCALA 125]